jgi:hypothetical protein
LAQRFIDRSHHLSAEEYLLAVDRRLTYGMDSGRGNNGRHEDRR